jgi:hypothetical protein
VKHAPAPKAAAEVVEVAGMAEVVGVGVGMVEVEVEEEVEVVGADTKIPVYYELRPWEW